MNHIIAESIIEDYILDLKIPHRVTYKNSLWFAQMSYSVWAAEEVLNYVRNNQNRPVIYVIEEFVMKMNRYSYINNDTSYVFSVAKDIAEDILDIFLAAQ